MAEVTGLEALKSQKQFLKLLGIWPVRNETVSYKLRYYLTILLGLGYTSLPLLAMSNHLVDYGELSELLSVCITTAVFCFKVFTLRNRKIYLVKLLQNMRQFPVEDNERAMMDAIKFSKRLVVLCTIVFSGTGVVFALQPLLGKQELPIEFSYDLGIYKNLMYGFQCLCAAIIALGLAFIDCLTINVISVGNAKLEILGEKIRNIGRLRKDLLAKKFSEIVADHNGLIQYMRYTEKVFSYCFFAQYLNSIGAMCNIALQLTRVDIAIAKLTFMALYLALMLLELALYSWFGNEVLVKSQDILQACYECKWYEYDIKIQKSIFIIMERSKIPLKLTAAKLATLSLQSFVSVIRSSYSFFTVMHQMYRKSNENI